MSVSSAPGKESLSGIIVKDQSDSIVSNIQLYKKIMLKHFSNCVTFFLCPDKQKPPLPSAESGTAMI